MGKRSFVSICVLLFLLVCISYSFNESPKQYYLLLQHEDMEELEACRVQISYPSEGINKTIKINVTSQDFQDLDAIMTASRYKRTGGYTTTNEKPFFRVFYDFSDDERYEVIILEESMTVNDIITRKHQRYTYVEFAEETPYQMLSKLFSQEIMRAIEEKHDLCM